MSLKLNQKKYRRQQMELRRQRKKLQNVSALTSGEPRCDLTEQQVSRRLQGGDISGQVWRGLKRFFNESVTQGGEWAGAPMPIGELPLVLEKRYPFQKLQGMRLSSTRPEDLFKDDPGVKVRNCWFSYEKNAHVYILEVDGKIKRFMMPLWGGKRLDLAVNTAGAHEAWSIDTEVRALSKLKEMVKPHLYEMYFLTGTLLETSKRTGIMYLFRKLRPTVAMRANDAGQVRILSILCLHPIGYYQGSFAGVMTPTDDVIAHLSLMRGDEAFFWRKANHHASYEPEAGL